MQQTIQSSYRFSIPKFWTSQRQSRLCKNIKKNKFGVIFGSFIIGQLFYRTANVSTTNSYILWAPFRFYASWSPDRSLAHGVQWLVALSTVVIALPECFTELIQLLLSMTFPQTSYWTFSYKLGHDHRKSPFLGITRNFKYVHVYHEPCEARANQANQAQLTNRPGKCNDCKLPRK